VPFEEVDRIHRGADRDHAATVVEHAKAEAFRRGVGEGDVLGAATRRERDRDGDD